MCVPGILRAPGSDSGTLSRTPPLAVRGPPRPPPPRAEGGVA